MLKRKRCKPRRSARPRRYDVEMIRDFLDHFRWEYVVNHFENIHELGTINPELVDQLAKYATKYKTRGLMASLELDSEGLSEETVSQATAVLRDIRAGHADLVLAALDALQPFLEEAFACATQPNALLMKQVGVTDVLEGSK